METNLNKQQQWKTKKFKSYYVVWKREWLEGRRGKQISLNRTM